MKRKNRKIACVALAVVLISGGLGLILLAAIGVKVATEGNLPELTTLLPGFCTLLAVMASSIIVMLLTLPKENYRHRR